jgi:hypothetical protein
VASTGIEKLSLLCEFHPMEKSWCMALGRGLRQEGCQIRKLVLQTQLSVDLAQALYEGMASRHRGKNDGPGLEDLSLQLSDACWQSTVLLSASLYHCHSLRRLSLNRHDLSYTLDDQQLEILAKSLRNHPSLKELCIEGSACKRGGIEEISKHLLLVEPCGSGCRLEKLDLSSHWFGTVDRFQGMEFLTEALTQNSSLRSLSLSGHLINETDMNGLTNALIGPHCRLKELCLSACHLSETCVKVLASKIPHMRSLKTLWLHDNPFHETSSAISLLSQAMRHNFEMEKLVLPFTCGGDTISRRKLQELDLWLFLNRRGRRLLYSTTEKVPPYLWAILLERTTLSSVKDMTSWSLGGTMSPVIPQDTTNDCMASSGETQAKELQLSAIFHLLQHGPISFDR